MILRALLFFAVLFALGFGIQGLRGAPGEVTLNWFGYHIVANGYFVLGAVFAFGLLMFTGGRIWSTLLGLPYHVKHWRMEHAEQEGLKALFTGLEALAAGDGNEASQQAKRVGRLLPDKRFSHLLSAEAAALQNNDKKQLEHYAKLVEADKSTLIGVRGLMEQSIKDNDWFAVIDLARQGLGYKPKSDTFKKTLFEAYQHTAQYEEALKILGSVSTFAKSEKDFYEACLRVQMARKLFNQKRDKSAIKEVNKALKLLPNFTPAALFKAYIYTEGNRPKQAEKTLRNFFKECPRLDVFHRWMETVAELEPEKFLKRAEKITKTVGNKPVAQLAFAEACMRCERWHKARVSLMKALENEESRRVYRLLAQLEDMIAPGTGADHEWLVKALDAPDSFEEYQGFVSAYNDWRARYVSQVKDDQLSAPVVPLPQIEQAG